MSDVKPMKIAVSGKGGVGKTTISAALSLLMARRGRRIIAVDADPDANLASGLGISEEEQAKIIPIAKHAALIEERTGAELNTYGQIFKLNPEVSDIADNFSTRHNGVDLLVLGAVSKGGAGCACAENTLIRALVTDLVLYKNEALVLDMEAGIEHLGRATASGVHQILIVVEPGQRSVDSAERIIRLCHDIGLQKIKLIANKVNGSDDEDFLRNSFPTEDFLAFIPYSEEIRRLDRNKRSVLDGISQDLEERYEAILNSLESPE